MAERFLLGCFGIAIVADLLGLVFMVWIFGTWFRVW